MKKLIQLFIFISLIIPVNTIYANQEQSPKTKIEKFSAKTGIVIIKRFEKIGSIRGDYGGSITVEAKEFINTLSNKKEYGITIEVKSSRDRENTSYINYDEIKSLIKGIDYISKINRHITNFSDFQADYSTKSNFKISTFTLSGKIDVAVSSGYIGRTTVFYNISSLSEIKLLILKAKTTINKLKYKK